MHDEQLCHHFDTHKCMHTSTTQTHPCTQTRANLFSLLPCYVILSLAWFAGWATTSMEIRTPSRRLMIDVGSVFDVHSPCHIVAARGTAASLHRWSSPADHRPSSRRIPHPEGLNRSYWLRSGGLLTVSCGPLNGSGLLFPRTVCNVIGSERATDARQRAYWRVVDKWLLHSRAVTSGVIGASFWRHLSVMKTIGQRILAIVDDYDGRLALTIIQERTCCCYCWLVAHDERLCTWKTATRMKGLISWWM